MNFKAVLPHCLTELSIAEVRILAKNTIYLGGLSFNFDIKTGPTIASYDNIRFFEGVSLVDRVSNINGSNFFCSEINLCEMSKRVVIIIGDKSELLEASQHTLVVYTSFHNDKTTDTNVSYTQSGIILLCLAILGDREVCSGLV